jgi:hypothetical protein
LKHNPICRRWKRRARGEGGDRSKEERAVNYKNKLRYDEDCLETRSSKVGKKEKKIAVSGTDGCIDETVEVGVQSHRSP